ncbi:MAG: hypothetical protein AAF824_03960 [Bacteroidota bacterium]
MGTDKLLFAKSEGFNLYGYHVPAFELDHNRLLKIWIQIVPPDPELSGYNFSKYLAKLLQKKRIVNGLYVDKSIPFAGNISENKILEKFYPLTVDRFLHRRKNINEESSSKIKSVLGVEGKDRINRMNFTSRKALSILSAFEDSTCISFDYYGLDHYGVQKINSIVERELQNGKSAIGFDNLYYLERIEPSKLVNQIIINANTAK